MAHSTPIPTEIEYHKQTKVLSISFDTAESYHLTAEYLRVYSPSAEVRGHSDDQAVLQVGKADVEIQGIEPVGTYAVLLRFDDGHDTGIYSWEWLYYLSQNQDTLWTEYLAKLEKVGAKRAPSN